MSTRTRYYPVVAFDLDGTLLQRTTVSLLIAKHFGQEEAIHELDRAFGAGEISNRAIADASAGVIAGRTTDEIEAVLTATTWIDGIDETIRALAEHGTQALVATITWKFAAEFLCERHGFVAASGTEHQVADGVVGDSISRYFDEHDKLRFVEAWCAEHGYSLSDVAAVGDSRSDLPLFRRAGRSVALNATLDARGAATVALDTDDLRDVLPLLVR